MNNVTFRRFMRQTYVIGIIDYGSQLWCPTDISLMAELEGLQRTFTANTKGLENCDYWDRLRIMKLPSIERRLQRYRIIYIWKIINGLVRNCGIIWNNHPYKGTLVNNDHPKVSEVSNFALNLWRQTLPIDGRSLFNMMPRYIRDIQDVSIDSFKNKLDKYLETIPDCPRTNNLLPVPINPISNKNSNCIMDWIRYIGRNKYNGDNVYYVNSH